MASFASIEAPAAIKLVKLEERVLTTTEQVDQNTHDIAEIRKQIQEHNERHDGD